MVKVVTQTPAPAPAQAPVDQVENLDQLAIEAQQLEATPTQAAQQVQAQEAQQAKAQTASNAAQLEQAAQIIRAMVLPVMPEHQREQLAQVWNDQVIKQASEAGAQVMQLHGIDMGDMLGRYAPYIALVAALAPPSIATARIIKTAAPAQQESRPDGQ